MNARIHPYAACTAAALTLATTLGVALAASPLDIDVPGRSADMTVPHGAPPAAKAGNTQAASPSPGDVGDADSFGRSLQWLGLADGEVDLAADCTGDTFPCTVLAAPPAVTSFSYTDLGHITLPARAAHSLLCYWFSPFLTIGYGNDGVTPVVAQLNYTPTVTIENPLLDDPSLIDPTTGLPFGGQLLTGMTSQEHFQVPLLARRPYHRAHARFGGLHCRPDQQADADRPLRPHRCAGARFLQAVDDAPAQRRRHRAVRRFRDAVFRLAARRRLISFDRRSDFYARRDAARAASAIGRPNRTMCATMLIAMRVGVYVIGVGNAESGSTTKFMTK